MQSPTLHLTRGVLALILDETRGMHNAFVDNAPQPGREIARALGDLSHNAYTPAPGVDPALRPQPDELLFVDYWADTDGMETFFSNPVALQAADRLFSRREEAEWAVAPNGFGFSVPAPQGMPPQYLAITRAPIPSAEVVTALGEPHLSRARGGAPAQPDVPCSVYPRRRHRQPPAGRQLAPSARRHACPIGCAGASVSR